MAYPERDEHGDIYNSVQLIDANGQRLLNYRKTHLFSELDKNMFCPGPDAFPVVELNGWKLGMLICYDLEFGERSPTGAGGGGVDRGAHRQHGALRIHCRCHGAQPRL